MLTVLRKSLGIVTTACDAVGISRQTHYNWLRNDPEYAQQVAEIDDVVLDFLESKAHKLVNDGDTSMTIFMLKTKAKKRGYTQTVEPIFQEDKATQKSIIDLGDGKTISI